MVRRWWKMVVSAGDRLAARLFPWPSRAQRTHAIRTAQRGTREAEVELAVTRAELTRLRATVERNHFTEWVEKSLTPGGLSQRPRRPR